MSFVLPECKGPFFCFYTKFLVAAATRRLKGGKDFRGRGRGGGDPFAKGSLPRKVFNKTTHVSKRLFNQCFLKYDQAVRQLALSAARLAA